MTRAQLLDRFAGMKAVVAGDLMLDEYIFGSATRISPEAPVMVIRQSRTRSVPGGAANVARNLTALGAEVSVLGVVGKDASGDALEEQLQGHGGFLLRDPERVTTRKTRIVANQAHQVLRIDHESDVPLNDRLEDELVSLVEDQLAGASVLVLSDYLKGTLSDRGVRAILEGAASRSVPVVANPKPRSAASYRGAALISLNRSELTALAGLERPVGLDEAVNVAETVREDLGFGALLATLGEAGMAAVNGQTSIRVHAPPVEVYDTAGAGDTVIATVALGIAAAGFSEAVFDLAACTSARVVMRVGVVAPSAEDLAHIRAS